MTIDFHNPKLRNTYATRDADDSWISAMAATIVDPRGLRVADIGCGGGIYSRAWNSLGAAEVVGVDFSEQMVSDAREASSAWPSMSFACADAANTGLPDASVDIVFERAIIHHLPDITSAFSEAFRILAPGGTLIVQDRTFEDVLHPASPEHLRGYFFEVFPRLLEYERERRPAMAEVTNALEQTGFTDLAKISFAETRRTSTSLTEIRGDLRARTGRSILHALSDSELEQLIDHITPHVEHAFPLQEHDYWTVWSSMKLHHK